MKNTEEILKEMEVLCSIAHNICHLSNDPDLQQKMHSLALYTEKYMQKLEKEIEQNTVPFRIEVR